MKEIVKPAIKGALTFVPGVRRALSETGTGGTNSAEYCYGVWLKHLTLLSANGMRELPHTVAELGPGDSLGTGLAAMLCGADRYFALDVVRHSNTEMNLRVLDELVALFRSRAPRPRKGWPDFDHHLDDDLFPSHILSDTLLEQTLSESRVKSIRALVENLGKPTDGMTIEYQVPWIKDDVIDPASVDLVVSHSVLEHVRDLPSTYAALRVWLKPGGYMSHQIDFTSHGLSKQWNGYRVYPEWLWNIVLGRRSFLINREPFSVHRALMLENNFLPICAMQAYAEDGIERSKLSRQWANISDDDLACSGAFVQALRG